MTRQIRGKKRLLAGFLLGAVLAPLAVCLFSSLMLPAEAQAVGSARVGGLHLVTLAMAEAFGSPGLAALVQSLLEDVTALTITKCVDFDPSDEAASLCGFDEPAAKLDITYATEGGAQQELHIVIGNRLPDGSGRYIRLGDDTTLFFLPTELLDPLMRIAAEGLGD